MGLRCVAYLLLLIKVWLDRVAEMFSCNVVKINRSKVSIAILDCEVKTEVMAFLDWWGRIQEYQGGRKSLETNWPSSPTGALSFQRPSEIPARTIHEWAFLFCHTCIYTRKKVCSLYSMYMPWENEKVLYLTWKSIELFVMYPSRDFLRASSSSSGGFLPPSGKMNRVIESNVHPLL